MLTQIAPALWEVDTPMTILGMALGHRMTVVRLPNGSLWLHSPVAYSESLIDELLELGPLAHIVAPNCMHDTYLADWFKACPGLQFHAAQGFSEYRPDLKFTDFLGDTPPPAWTEVFIQHLLRGAPRLNEIVFLHRASRTLILTDLCFNLGPDMPMLSRVLLSLNGCYCRFAPSRLLRSTIKDRAAFRASLDQVLKWDFDRVVLSHGRTIESGAKSALREAFNFL
jgi:hypothetical protein